MAKTFNSYSEAYAYFIADKTKWYLEEITFAEMTRSEQEDFLWDNAIFPEETFNEL